MKQTHRNEALFRGFVWITSKPTAKLHMIGRDGKTYCKAEDGIARELDGFSIEMVEGRDVCHLCKMVAVKKAKPKVKKSKSAKAPKDDFHTSYAWRQTRYAALKLYDRKCMCCGRTPPEVQLHVDHIKPRKFYPNLALEITNLQILCHECNHGKGNWDETDWRTK